jgi:hypothetical protein
MRDFIRWKGDKMFKTLSELQEWISLCVQNELKELEYKLKRNENLDYKKQWDLETGEKSNDIINNYPVSEEMLLNICKEFAEFSEITMVDSIKDYLFVDYNNKIPRLKSMLGDYKILGVDMVKPEKEVD